ncbi:MAG TPA: hypothetical protein VKB80_03415 [Kofleriaceae bacterium]|nr:hypothetical protein [Kofleriaceae bacterium]
MTIVLNVRPGPALMRDEFLATHPPFSIALDGYVFGEPWLIDDPARPFRNFNHHESVDRSCMSATCEQARRAVVLGLYDLFRRHGARCAELWVNDCDQDVCLATWILMNPDRATEPLVRMISQIEDLLDMSAGAYPMPQEGDLLGQVRWVFEPYARARAHIAGMSGDAMREVIRDVHHRLDCFAIGRAERLSPNGDYRRIGGGEGWVFAEVTHPTAREMMVASGTRAAVELFGRAGPSGERYLYSLWRRSEYVVGFPVPALLAALNQAEGFQPVDPAGWGGAQNVGGSPRGRGSALAPEDVESIVNDVVASASAASRGLVEP